MLLLTQCAACATELGLSLGKKCGRCSTRYCGAACQAQHWKELGHDKLCEKIKKAGGAEKYHADKKYKEAVAVAAEACAEDTKGHARQRRVCGGSHPGTLFTQSNLETARGAIARIEARVLEMTRAALDAKTAED